MNYSKCKVSQCLHSNKNKLLIRHAAVLKVILLEAKTSWNIYGGGPILDEAFWAKLILITENTKHLLSFNHKVDFSHVGIILVDKNKQPQLAQIG